MCFLSRCPLVSARRPFPVFVLFLVLFGSVCWFANASEPTLRLLRSLPPPQLFPPRKGRAKTLASEKKNARWESAPSKFPKNTLSLFFLLSPTVSRWLFEGSPSQTPRFPLTLRQNSHSKWVQHAETHTDTHHTRVRTSRQVWDTENAINERRNGAPLRGVLGSSASARMRNHNAPQHTPVR